MRPDATATAMHIPIAVRGERIAIVASGKGGVGTSVTAALLALECANQGARTLLIDGNEGAGTQHLLFGVRPTRSLDVLRDAHVPVDEVLIPLGDMFTLVPCRAASGEQAAFTPGTRRAPFERLLPLSLEYDCVVVDGGSRLDSVLSVADSGARRAVLVTDADRISLAGTFALVKALGLHAPDVRGSLVINRHEATVAERAGEQLSGACRRFLDADLPLAGTLPDDACLRAALGAGMPVGDAAQGSPAAHAVQQLASRVFPFLDAAQLTASHSSSTSLRRRS